MAAWEVTDRVREDDDPRRRLDRGQPPPEPGATTSETAEAHLDDLINEDSAATAAQLEEEERARAAALATAPIRAASASRATLGRAVTGMSTGATAALSTAAGAAGTAGRTLRRTARAAAGSVHRPGRRLGLAALTAIVVAAPAAGSPAPWASLVGASINGIGGGAAPGGVRNDLLSHRAFGSQLTSPSTPSAAVPLDGSTPAGLDTTANPTLAGLPIGHSDLSIPPTVERAYKKAADRMAVLEPGCQLTWTLLAGIGKVESNHARLWSGNEQLTPNGTVSPKILGPLLDGSLSGTALLPDTDGGRLDGNAQFDRAVGPMQFVPGTWAIYGSDDNGDGVSDPNNVWDASLGTAKLLCSGGRDLGNAAQQAAAVFAYNGSTDYVRTVLAWALAYGSGAEIDLSGLPTGDFGLPTGAGGTPGVDVPLGGSFSGTGSPYADPELGAPVVSPAPQQPVSPPRNTPPSGHPSSPATPPTAPPHSTPPTPPGTPSSPPSNPQPSFALSLTSLTATRAKTAADYDSVTVTATVDATTAGSSQLVLRLAGSGRETTPDPYYVTGALHNVTFAKGSNTVRFVLDGGFLGDSGVDGPYSASLTQRETTSDGSFEASSPSDLGPSQLVGVGWKADEFVDNIPSLQRIWNRVDEFNGLSMLDTPLHNRLQQDLSETNLTNALRDFRRDLGAASTASVSREAATRLNSLADRLASKPNAAGPPPQPRTSAQPGPDPVRGPSSR
jgi:membrane-bound lytic murein transglycosylase B